MRILCEFFPLHQSTFKTKKEKKIYFFSLPLNSGIRSSQFDFKRKLHKTVLEYTSPWCCHVTRFPPSFPLQQKSLLGSARACSDLCSSSDRSEGRIPRGNGSFDRWLGPLRLLLVVVVVRRLVQGGNCVVSSEKGSGGILGHYRRTWFSR